MTDYALLPTPALDSSPHDDGFSRAETSSRGTVWGDHVCVRVDDVATSILTVAPRPFQPLSGARWYVDLGSSWKKVAVLLSEMALGFFLSSLAWRLNSDDAETTDNHVSATGALLGSLAGTLVFVHMWWSLAAYVDVQLALATAKTFDFWVVVATAFIATLFNVVLADGRLPSLPGAVLVGLSGTVGQGVVLVLSDCSPSFSSRRRIVFFGGFWALTVSIWISVVLTSSSQNDVQVCIHAMGQDRCQSSVGAFRSTMTSLALFSTKFLFKICRFPQRSVFLVAPIVVHPAKA